MYPTYILLTLLVTLQSVFAQQKPYWYDVTYTMCSYSNHGAYGTIDFTLGFEETNNRYDLTHVSKSGQDPGITYNFRKHTAHGAYLFYIQIGKQYGGDYPCFTSIKIITNYENGETFWLLEDGTSKGSTRTYPAGIVIGDTVKPNLYIEHDSKFDSTYSVELKEYMTRCDTLLGKRVTDDHFKCGVCGAAHYGYNCSKTCSLCTKGCGPLTCDCIKDDVLCKSIVQTGKCCDDMCPVGTFQAVGFVTTGCVFNCTCKDGVQCYAWSGYCPTGCALGYTTLVQESQCQHKCAAGYYYRTGASTDCTKNCHCHNGSDCFETGDCPSGCDPNYRSDGSTAHNCQKYTSNNL